MSTINKQCTFCSAEAVVSRKSIVSWHYSGKLKVTYENVYICLNEACFQRFIDCEQKTKDDMKSVY
jgi:hypothetical protein